MKITNFVLGAALAATFLVGCGDSSSGSSNSGSQTVTSIGETPLSGFALAARLGPVTYDNGDVVAAANNAQINYNTTAAATGFIAAIFPEAAPVLGPISAISTWFAGNQAASQTTNQINAIQAEMNAFQTSLNNLQNQINNDQYFFKEFVGYVTGSNACGAYAYIIQNQFNLAYTKTSQNLANGNSAFSGACGQSLGLNAQGSFGSQFQNTFSASTPSEVNATAINQSTMTNLNSQVLKAIGNNYVSYVGNLSGTNTPADGGSPSLTYNYNAMLSYVYDMNISSKSAVAKPSQAYCTPGQGNALQQVLQCQYVYLTSNLLPMPGQQSSVNVVNTINSYNNTLFNLFQQNLMALQQAYYMQATINYLNYVNYSSYLNGTITQPTQIASLESFVPITFSVGSGTYQIPASDVNTTNVAQYLTVAQQNLATVYALRINAMYKAIMNYVISDPQMSSQSYTQPFQKLSYMNGNFQPQGSLYQTIATSSIVDANGTSRIPTQKVITNSSVFYQYNGINQVYSCLQSVYNTLKNPSSGSQTIVVNANTCPSAFPYSNSTYYDGLGMQATWSSSPTNFGQTNYLWTSDCSPNDQSIALGGSTYSLVCNTWGGSRYVNIDTLPAFGFNASGGFNINNNYKDSYILNNDANMDFTFIASSTGNNQPAAYNATSGNFRSSNLNSNNPWLTDGGFGSGESTHHTVFMQAKLPNGYNMPLYFSANVYNNIIWGSLTCPSQMMYTNPDGIKSCSTNFDYLGSITVTTIDNQTYHLGIQPLQSHSQGGYYGGNLFIIKMRL